MGKVFGNDKSTRTKGKLVQEERLRREYLSSLDLTEGYTIVLTGPALKDHIQHLTEAGIPEHRIVVVERDLATYKSIKRSAGQLGFQGLVVCGDLLEVCKRFAGQISYIEADGTMCFGDWCIELINFAAATDVKVLWLVGSARLKYAPKWAHRIGFRRTYKTRTRLLPSGTYYIHKHPTKKGYSNYNLIERTLGWLTNYGTARDYTYEHSHYEGTRTPMYSIMMEKESA